MKKLIFITFISLFLMYCAGAFPFSSVNSHVSNTGNTTEIHTTTGQELLDLQQALDSGAITQEEYDELKLKIIERFDEPADSTDTN